MNIQMIGIDHMQANLTVRERFAFTRKSVVCAMKQFCEVPGIFGCVILSTCNRTEVWIDTKESWSENIHAILCRIKGMETAQFAECFKYRKGKEAVTHLFQLASGLKSQIRGEDQILTQIKDALTLAREAGYSNNSLEVLFRMAVTAGKQVKTDICFPRKNRSAIEMAFHELENNGYLFLGKRCMVIGNGQMGILAAQVLLDRGADVAMTIRSYRHGEVNIPENCKRIAYEKRAEYVPECDYIISATASPHHTITKELLQSVSYKEGLCLMDFAVPRDIACEVQKLPGIVLYDIDDFVTDVQEEEHIQRILLQVQTILDAQMESFYTWAEGTAIAPHIQLVKEDFVEDFRLRVEKQLAENLSAEQKEVVQKVVEQAAEKAVNKLLYGVKKSLPAEVFQTCILNLEKLYEEEK